MKTILFLIFFVILLTLYSQQLELTTDGQSYLVQSAPNQNWLIARDNDQFIVFGENFESVAAFNLGTHQNSVSWIYGVARDFDTDDNIEVLYQTTINDNYSIFLRDITTGQIQIQYNGTASYWYYCNNYGYLGNERIFVISRYNLSSYSYDVSYVYRSGNPQNSTDEPEIPIRQKSIINYPNPFSPDLSGKGTTINFTLLSSQKGSLNIYNAKGQFIKNLVDSQTLPKGENAISWNGLNENSKPLPSGVYFYKLETEDTILIEKSLIIK